MTDQVDNRDDAVARLRQLTQPGPGSVEGKKGGADSQSDVDDLVRWIDEREWLIRKKDVDFATIVEASSQISAKSLDLAKIEAYSMTMLMGQFGYLRAFFMRPQEFAHTKIEVVGKSKNLPKVAFEVDSDVGRHLKDAAQPLDIGPLADAFEEFEPLRAFGVEAVLPLVIADRMKGDMLKGCICVGQRIGNRPLKAEERKLLSLLANLIAVSVHNAQLYHDSIVDGLTQVYGRSHFDVRLRNEMQRVERRRQRATEEGEQGLQADRNASVSLVLLDIDHFKRVNDTYGHQAGDLVLQHVARYLSDNVRQVDVVARYGGEEFALILPEASKNDALSLTERLRVGLHQQRVDDTNGQRLQVTASFGVASYPDDADGARELVALADQALYRAKAEGRNRVSGATRPPADAAGEAGGEAAGDDPEGVDVDGADVDGADVDSAERPTQQGVRDGA